MSINTTTTLTAPLEAYMALPEGAPYQLIEGELIMSPAPKIPHQNVVGNFFTELKNYLTKTKEGKAIVSPADVHFDDLNVFQPDVLFVSNARKGIIQDNVMGAPDLIMEVLSPNNAYYDLRVKKDIYARFGVKEYWIVDPLQKTIELFTLRNESYILHQELKQKGTITSVLLPGFTIEWAGLFE